MAAIAADKPTDEERLLAPLEDVVERRVVVLDLVMLPVVTVAVESVAVVVTVVVTEPVAEEEEEEEVVAVLVVAVEVPEEVGVTVMVLWA